MLNWAFETRKDVVKLRHYEALMITQPRPTREGVQGDQAAFEDAVRKQGGKILGHTDLGKRTLGYEVKKAKEGYVTTYDFELLPEKIESLKQMLERADDILKFMVTVKPKTVSPRQKLQAKPKMLVTAKR